MNVIESTSRAKTAERAYYFFLDRQQRGIPGTEHDDWLRAEASFQRNELPLTALKGVGPKVAAELAACGVRSVSDLAAWELADFGENLPRLTARAKSGRWIEQARQRV